MKHLKMYENATESFYVRKYSGNVYIDVPSTKYFNSDTLLQAKMKDEPIELVGYPEGKIKYNL